MPDWLISYWPLAATLLVVAVAAAAAGHVILRRRDSRAALLWIGLIWLAPIVGSGLYFLLGINRVKRRARMLRHDVENVSVPTLVEPLGPAEMGQVLTAAHAHLHCLERVVGCVVTRPLLPGNSISILRGGEGAYPAMLSAIDQAETSISLTSFIFANDSLGHSVVDSLAAAQRRGVSVRVLVDGAGARYSFPTILGRLRAAGLRTATFHPRPWFLPSGTINMRNHRKICVIDGGVGFTGSMNLKQEHFLTGHAGDPIQDLHFRIEGPVVAHLQEVFAEDWQFATDEQLTGRPWFPDLEARGGCAARGIADGPDEDLDKLRWCLLGALNVARESITIVTPYFLPDPALTSAINVAAMRGVAVRVFLPETTNIRLVQWAMRATLWEILEHGSEVWLTPPPFDHTKLMLVDREWVLLGSANWDPRSLRLNFEFNVEVYDATLAAALYDLVDQKQAAARRLELAQLRARSLPSRLRDGVARLFTPVL